MFRKLWLRATSIALLMFIPFTLRLAQTSFAGAPEPPAPGAQLAGPRVVGHVELDGLNLTFFSGKCGGQPIPQIQVGEFVVDIPTLVPLDLVDFLIVGGTTLLPQCFAGQGITGDLIVTRVKDFFNNGTKVVAEVTIRALVAP